MINFYVSNFKGLREVKLDALNGLNVVVGYNGYGKTNLLSAIYMFFKNLESGLERKSFDDNNQEYILLWKDYDISKPIIMSGKIALSRAEAEKVLDRAEEVNVEVTNRIFYSRNVVSWETVELNLNGKPPSGEGLERIRKIFSHAEGQIEYIPIFDQNYFDQVLRRMAELNRSPINLRKYWYDFVNLTGKVIPEIKGLEFWEFKKLVLNVYNTPIYIDVAASGFQKVILMLFILWLSAGKVLLIEEPEVNMHPLLQVKVLKLIRKWSSEDFFQVFLSTHSPFFASSDGGRKFIVMRRRGASSEALPIDLDDEMRLTLSLLSVDISDLVFSRSVVLIGDNVEIPVVKAWMMRVGVDPDEAGIRILKLRTELDLQLWQRIKEKLNLKLFVLGSCDKLQDGLKDSCVSLGKEAESFYDRNIVLSVLKEMGINPDERELRELGRDELTRWISNVMKRRGFDYVSLREQIGKLVASKSSVEVPREIEVLANKMKASEAIA